MSRVIKPERFSTLACQLLHGVGQLLYEVHLLTASGGVAGGHKFSWPYDLLPLQPALIL